LTLVEGANQSTCLKDPGWRLGIFSTVKRLATMIVSRGTNMIETAVATTADCLFRMPSQRASDVLLMKLVKIVGSVLFEAGKMLATLFGDVTRHSQPLVCS
jgi:hypothetical protein